ncbi:M15 family metallopeptidase [Amycolatopsis sp. 195334CR]|uniref:M15 family metallopeptidase n=1 Tax=Amycolatopsis sp. 195334CR TaxID=2814588 RepID=UPI001A8F9C4C|nr:M15 family metallopeptidase [Amycolatopsis sp. 195334CR]MBN6036294.1 M15 family metallopeptidase [Amycolatopsis sp. 195334CR]
MSHILRKVLAAAAAVLVSGATFAAPASAAPPRPFVVLQDFAPTIQHDIRYYGPHNFVGTKIDGYREPLCILTRPAAEALRRVQWKMLSRGYTLKVYDCFRPQRSVDHFVRWAKDLEDEKMKPEFYPNVAKDRLFADGYIAEKSGHSRGSTVDLTVVKLPPRHQRPYVPGEPLQPCTAPAGERFPDNSVDMGTGFDCFDTLSHTANPLITGKARENRDLLVNTMAEAGFRNLVEEWWHFTLNDEPYPDTYFDFPVSRKSVYRP